MSCKAGMVSHSNLKMSRRRSRSSCPSWIGSSTMTTVDGGPEETDRRRGLNAYVHRLIIAPTDPDHHRSTFQKIEEISQKLLAKSTMTQFTDKGEDSKMRARLIERLREAIVCYQVANHCVLVSGIIATRGVDIATKDNPPSNRSSHGRSSCYSEIDGDQPVSQGII